MNNFQSIDSGKGILKDNYESRPIAEALKRKLKKKELEKAKAGL